MGALAYSIILGPRQGSGPNTVTKSHRPHSISNVMLGTAFLWFGWFGFNAGSALRRRNIWELVAGVAVARYDLKMRSKLRLEISDAMQYEVMFAKNCPSPPIMRRLLLFSSSHF